MRDTDIAWLAGIIEGEGTIIIPSDKKLQVNIIVGMTDKDVVQRCHEITGIGTFRSSWTKQGNKQNYKWCVYKQKDVARILLAIVPLMGERRKKRIEEAAEIFHERFRWRNCPACEILFQPSGRWDCLYCSDCKEKHSYTIQNMKRKRALQQIQNLHIWTPPKKEDK